CKQWIFFEQKVGDHRRAKQIELCDVSQLLHALKQEEQLGRQRISCLVAIKALQKWIRLWLLPPRVRRVMLRELGRKRSLAGAHRAFDYDIPIPAGESHATAQRALQTARRVDRIRSSGNRRRLLGLELQCREP